MLLELADRSKQVFVPATPGVHGAYEVPDKFFDKLNDYEFSQTITELLPYNQAIDLKQFILERDGRRALLGLPMTRYAPQLESKFGDWIKNTGKKIESFFQPTKPTTGGAVGIDPATGQAVTINPAVGYVDPNSGLVVVSNPNANKGTSPFLNVVKGIAGAFGLNIGGNQQPYIIPQQKSAMEEILPYAVVGLGAYLLTRRRR